ncbi:hypothetical protein [Salinigranum marinum]|uniref:hypothetical protein n=1 Tax=Salinigranum marinum TaxID=1515595 RepID=UPI002989E5CD|nr:hypothetical protein [Salinigranum marinum]
MGLKSGSRDSGLDDADGDADATDDVSPSADRERPPRTDDAGADSPEDSTDRDGTANAGEAAAERPTMDSIPYKLRRSKVNEGREQVPYFLRTEVIEAEPDLRDTLEERLGENVYKSDYREAAMIVAQRHPDLVARVLREWGYDLDSDAD